MSIKSEFEEYMKEEQMKKDRIKQWELVDKVVETPAVKSANNKSISDLLASSGVGKQFSRLAKQLGMSNREYFIYAVGKTHPTFVKKIYKFDKEKSFYDQFRIYLMAKSKMRLKTFLRNYIRSME